MLPHFVVDEAHENSKHLQGDSYSFYLMGKKQKNQNMECKKGRKIAPNPVP